MRSCVTILLLITSTCTYAQLKGHTYSNDGETYQFLNDHSVLWRRQSSNGTEDASGSYYIKKDSIELEFDEFTHTFELQQFKAERYRPYECRIEVRAMFSDGRPIKGMRVILTKPAIEATMDSRGIAVIDTDKEISGEVFIDLDGSRSRLMSQFVRGQSYSFGIVVDDTPPRFQSKKPITLAFKKMWGGIRLGNEKFKKSKREILLGKLHSGN